MNLRRTLYVYLLLALAAVLQNLVHESLHALLALISGVGVQEFRFLTGPLLTSQVVYDVPVGTRTGAHWLFIGLGPAVITTLIGFTVYLLRDRIITRWPALNLFTWYIGALFMTIDPIYYGLLSWFLEGSDVNAVAAVNWPVWPVRVLGLIVSAVSTGLVLRWRTEARQHVERYSVALPRG